MKKKWVSALLLVSAWHAFADTPGDVVRQKLEQTSLQYFLENAHPRTGLVRDTALNKPGTTDVSTRCSIAATGFGLAVIVHAGEVGLIPRAQAQAYAERTLRFTKNTLEHRKGWLYHFIDWETGLRWRDSEYSTIDTALFMGGAIYAGQIYAGTEVEKLARELYERLDFEEMRTEGGTKPGKLFLTSSYRPEDGYSDFQWRDYNESMLLYLLGLGHPTKPLPAESWNAWQREALVFPGGRNLIGYDKPLFTHQYSFLFVDFRRIRDSFTNYFENAMRATLYNRDISARDSRFLTFREGFWGLSAGDTRDGYDAFTPLRYDGTVCPGCVVASMIYLPAMILDEAGRWMNGPRGAALWGKYGFTDSFNLDQNWISEQVHGITVGPIYMALANLGARPIWDTFNTIPAIKRALDRAGFVADPPSPPFHENTLLATSEPPRPAWH